jgi:hypothetical protein
MIDLESLKPKIKVKKNLKMLALKWYLEPLKQKIKVRETLNC